MLLADIEEIQQDILEAFIDVGTPNELVNIFWLKRKYAEYDTVTKQSTEGIFVEYEMFGLVTKRIPKDEKEQEGLNARVTAKIYLVGSSFDEYEFEPDNADRVNHLGIVYEVDKIKPIPLADKNLLWVAYLMEAEFAAQQEGYREQEDPIFEIDASQDENQTNDTGVNINDYVLTHAEVIGINDEFFDIIAGVSDTVEIRVKTVTKTLYLLEGTLSAQEIVDDLNSKIAVEYGEKLLVAYTTDGKVHLKSYGVGSDEVIEIMDVLDNAYDVLGWAIGVYIGKEKLNIIDTDAYSDGDPLYFNG